MYFLIDASRANNEKKTGVEWYAYFVIQELKKIIPSDWQVVLYTREKLKGELGVLPSNWQEKILAWPPKRLWTQLRLSYEIYHFKKQHLEEEIILFVPAHVLPLVCPAKTLITIHDLGGVRFAKGYSFFERFYTYFATWFALKKGQVIVPSQFVFQELSYFFKENSHKIKVVYNAFDKQSFQLSQKNQSASVIKKYGLTGNYFFSIGRLEEKKNTVGIIQAFNFFRQKSTQSWQLVLLGKPGFGFEKVTQEIANSPFAGDIIIPGWVEQGDVPFLMAGAQALLLPSFYEGFGIPILEAFAMGVPVITSNLTSMPEVSGGAALLVNPYKPQEISKAMYLISTQENLVKALVEKGLNRAQEFDWRKTAQDIFKVAESL
ncbi:MAG TPA: glycosyltransferase family 1 protein [Candidatus Magasanikbacteria bacterium]|nr:glycosyltransferase family 1 protein [Candidatus Magasanikbacteria bacterium]